MFELESNLEYDNGQGEEIHELTEGFHLQTVQLTFFEIWPC